MPIEEASRLILAEAGRLGEEETGLAEAAGRVLAAPLLAQRTQPPFPAAVMDGYAVRSVDTSVGARLAVIGEAAAGRRFSGTVGAGQAVRIFTGAPVPRGADAVVAQETVTREGGAVVLAGQVPAGHFVRAVGVDFSEGETILPAGRRIGPRDLALAAAANVVRLRVSQRPKVAVVSIGDELVAPGTKPGPDQIVASNAFAVVELARDSGAETEDLGIVADDADAFARIIAEAARRVDVLVTIGGASVGDHDVTKPALAAAGMTLGLWQIAMRPGKPLVFGRIGRTAVLGLPGNPVSSYVCAAMFLRPLLAALQGTAVEDRRETAILAAPVQATGPRTTFLRATLQQRAGDFPAATPFADQDSSLLTVLAGADCLVVRDVGTPAAPAGEKVAILRLRP